MTIRGLDTDGEAPAHRNRLETSLRSANKAWVKSLLQREIRKQLQYMGLPHTGKMWHLSSRLEDALWEGKGKAPDFNNKVPDARMYPRSRSC